MKPAISLFASLCLFCVTGAAIAQDQPQTSLPAVQIVAAREAIMTVSGAVRGYMKAAILNGADAKKAVYPADGLALWAKALPGMFPKGTGPDAVKTYARSRVWSDRALFQKYTDNFIAATGKLSRLAHANDTADFKDQLEVVEQRCTACHAVFRSKLPR